MSGKTIWIIEWDEFEEGYGPRSDGYSLHLSIEKANAWAEKEIKAYTGIHTSQPGSDPYIEAVPNHVYERVVSARGLESRS